MWIFKSSKMKNSINFQILINLDPNKYSQEFHYSPFAVKLVRCVGSCYTLNDLYAKVGLPNRTKDLNLNVFNMIAGENESKTLTRYIWCDCKSWFDGRNVIQINGGIMINVDVNGNNVMYVKKIMVIVLLHIIMKLKDI